MQQIKLCATDYKFMCVVWANEPVSSGELVKLCFNTLGWKKSTTYTMLKKMADKGYLQNQNSVVSSLIPQADVQTFESAYVVDNAFKGSLTAFVAAFVCDRKLSAVEAEKLKKLIAENTED